MKNYFFNWSRDFTLLAIAVFCLGVFFGVQMTLFNNFVVERIGIEAHELGYIEAMREIPGLLNVVFIALMVRVVAPILGGFSLIILGVGIIGYAWSSTVVAIALFSVIWSIGFHGWITLQHAMALKFSPGTDKGVWLGKLHSVNSFGWLITIGICIFAFRHIGYEGLFIMGGIVTIIGGTAIFFASKDKPIVPEKGFVFKKRYRLYYILNVLDGCRRQIFMTFAIFALVKVHGMPIKTTMILVLINKILVILVAPLMGRLVDTRGERLMLSFTYFGLIFVFLGYAIIEYRPLLYVLFCIDNLLFFEGIALTTFINKITPAEELKPTLSMGVTMNHVAAVTAPLIGGLVWYHFGYKIIFLSGAIIAMCSFLASQWVDPEGMLRAEAENDDVSLPDGVVAPSKIPG